MESDLRPVTTSKITAISSTPPLMTYCQELPRPMMDMPMLMPPTRQTTEPADGSMFHVHFLQNDFKEAFTSTA